MPYVQISIALLVAGLIGLASAVSWRVWRRRDDIGRFLVFLVAVELLVLALWFATTEIEPW